MPVEVALVQARPVLGDLKANAAKVIEALKRERADIVVFPELFLSGYAMRDGFAQVALHADHPVLAELLAACRATGKTLVTGAPWRSEVRGLVHNSLLLLTPQGLAGRYDKVYLPTFSLFEEDLFFAEGREIPVFEVDAGGERLKLGLCICYDLFFPEVPKALARAGADVIVCSAASPTPSRESFEPLFPARAIENTTYVLFTNLAGAQDAAIFWGGAQGWSPRGKLLAKGPYDAEGVTTVTIDLAEVAEARRRRPVLRDTRAEVLRMLLDAGPE